MLEDHVAKTVENGMKLNAVDQKHLNRFKQKLKKNNVNYQQQIAEYRKVNSLLVSFLSLPLPPSFIFSLLPIRTPMKPTPSYVNNITQWNHRATSPRRKYK
jgi:hypothetical protein